MYPNFLCIGAMKTGTTWLCENLRQHPGIWLPREKEIHYFTGWGRPCFSWPRHLKRSLRRPGIQSMLMSDLSNLRFRSMPWDLRYLFGRRNDRWYASLFKGGRGKITGDMSATYAELDRPAVEHVFKLMPHVKVIYGLRNPIERAWSHALMAIDKRIGTFGNSEQQYGELHQEDFIRFLKAPWQSCRRTISVPFRSGRPIAPNTSFSPSSWTMSSTGQLSC